MSLNRERFSCLRAISREAFGPASWGGISLYSFSVIPRAQLTGLITLGEQDFLEMASSQKDFSLRIFRPTIRWP